MENFARMGLIHRAFRGSDVKILESYLAPVTPDLDGTTIKKGIWLLAIRILGDDLWDKVKSGDLTGFSIGGSAARKLWQWKVIFSLMKRQILAHPHGADASFEPRQEGDDLGHRVYLLGK